MAERPSDVGPSAGAHEGAHQGSTTDAQTMTARYAKRQQLANTYSAHRWDVQQLLQERDATLRSQLVTEGWRDLSQRRAVEVGCGAGGNLQSLVNMGFAPQHLHGIDLLPERIAAAQKVLPAAVTLHVGDASVLDLPPQSVDLCLQYTVFSSLLQDASRQQLAQSLWRWLKPGGAVVSYDFCVPSPGNRDVRAFTVAQCAALFPQGQLRHVRRVTLAPPLARVLARIHPSLHRAAHAVPLLRTHRMVWITKP
jgi:SAM-dependent methyltransferase